MNASELLRGHEVGALFTRLESIDAGDTDGLREIARELRARMEIEERTVYPIARTTEHHADGSDFTVAAAVLARLEVCGPDPKLLALLELVEAVAPDEEQVDVEELERIGDELAARVEQAMIASTIVAGRGRRQRDRERVRMAARRR